MSMIGARRMGQVAALVVVSAAAGGLSCKPASPPPSRDAAPAKGAAPTLTTAQFTVLRGRVEVRKAGGTVWAPAGPETKLVENDVVRTGPGSEAELTFYDGRAVRLGPEAELTITEKRPRQ
jgi:hypothetical protein